MESVTDSFGFKLIKKDGTILSNLTPDWCSLLKHIENDVYVFKYKETDDDGYFTVEHPLYCLMDGKTGKMISDRYWLIDEFVKGYALVSIDRDQEESNYIGTDGKLLLDENVGWGSFTNNGLAIVMKFDKDFNYIFNIINTSGEYMLPEWVKDLHSFAGDDYINVDTRTGDASIVSPDKNTRIIRYAWIKDEKFCVYEPDNDSVYSLKEYKYNDTLNVIPERKINNRLYLFRSTESSGNTANRLSLYDVASGKTICERNHIIVYGVMCDGKSSNMFVLNTNAYGSDHYTLFDIQEDSGELSVLRQGSINDICNWLSDKYINTKEI